ncbi:capsule biosynthesis GfcC D2 domain-containing protein [Escherichia coli]
MTIYLPGEQQTLSVGPVENVVQLVTQPQLRDRLWWPGALLTDSAAKAKALKDYQHVMAQLASWEAEADDDVAATIKSVRQQLLNLNITGRLPVKLDPDFVRVDENSNPRWSGLYALYRTASGDYYSAGCGFWGQAIALAGRPKRYRLSADHPALQARTE